jgi:hypothetical protein
MATSKPLLAKAKGACWAQREGESKAFFTRWASSFNILNLDTVFQSDKLIKSYAKYNPDHQPYFEHRLYARRLVGFYRLTENQAKT